MRRDDVEMHQVRSTLMHGNLLKCIVARLGYCLTVEKHTFVMGTSANEIYDDYIGSCRVCINVEN